MSISFVNGRLVSSSRNRLSLPVVKINNCGECTACCTILPISKGSNFPFDKPSGETCEHCTGKGCSIFAKPEWPSLCKNYLCDWRDTRWLGDDASLRPDIGGCLYQTEPDLLAVFETRKGAHLEPKNVAVIQKYCRKYSGRHQSLRVNVYLYEGATWKKPIMRYRGGIGFGEGLNFIYYTEPYEHFVIEQPTEKQQKQSQARTVSKWFLMNPHRQEMIMQIGDKTKELPRSCLPVVQKIIDGEDVEAPWPDGNFGDPRFKNKGGINQS